MTHVVLTVHDWTPGPFQMPAGHTEFVVGDAHGYIEQLRALLEAGRDLAPDAFLTLLGDLVDRGPDSLGCLKLGCAAVLDYRKNRAGGMYLPGNHEQMLIGAMVNSLSSLALLLLNNGGDWVMKLGIERLASALEDALGEEAFGVLTQDYLLLQNSPDAVLHRRVGNTILVHAGIHPVSPDPEAWIRRYAPLEIRKDLQTPLWIRDTFLYHDGGYPDDVVVVHGHTPEDTIFRIDTDERAPMGEHVLCGSRLGLDGGSYDTGFVTGALIRNGEYRVITAYADPKA